MIMKNTITKELEDTLKEVDSKKTDILKLKTSPNIYKVNFKTLPEAIEELDILQKKLIVILKK